MHADLARYIADCPKDGPAFIATMYGRARSEKAFSSWISEAAGDAGLPEGSSPHGVRKAACRRLAEAGCSALEIMSVTGHTNIREIERYCREAAKKKLAVAAMAKLQKGFDASDNPKLPNQAQRLGKNSDKPLKSLEIKSDWRSRQDSNRNPRSRNPLLDHLAYGALSGRPKRHPNARCSLRLRRFRQSIEIAANAKALRARHQPTIQRRQGRAPRRSLATKSALAGEVARKHLSPWHAAMCDVGWP
ncbi:hypothetical protein AB7M49_003249 [Bradyrhizobium elkanii]